jgi:MFS-type transporter involved in bile tolerance (Atg22 family)
MPEMGGNRERLFIDLIAVNKVRRKFSLSNFLLLIVKGVIAIVFLPVFILFGALESRFFLKLLKRIVFAIYLFLIGVCVYTFITRNEIIKSTKKVTVEINFHDKMREFK